MTMPVTNNPNGPATASTSTAANSNGPQHQHSREASNETTSSGSTVPPVPRVGGVRCYWALLRPSFPSAADPNSKFELTFVHFDPVLSVHLRRERLSMLGRGVIEFIHPNEREQARKDLAGAIAVDDLQGSVTRVRYARLSRIRSLLGCPAEEIDVPAEMEKIAEDKDFLILDLVLNWAADGLLLGFFHAIRDVDTRMNNDPAAKHLAWSNWCGTEHMPEDQIEAIAENIATALKPSRRDRNPPSRVFQIHTTDAAPTRPSSTVFSWPPSRPETETLDGSLPLHDGLYDAEEYKFLMKGVDMDPSSMTAPEETRTNCTTRFGAKHSLNSEGVFRQINSVFIPYGSLIFACFQTVQTIEQGAEEPEPTNPFSLPGGYEYPPPNGIAPPPVPPMTEAQWGPPVAFEGFPPKPTMQSNPSQTSLGKRTREDAPVMDWRPPPPPPAMTSHHFPPLQGFPPQPSHPEAGPSRFARNGLPPHSHAYPPPQEYMQPEPPYPYNPQYMPASGYQAVSHARGTSPGKRDVIPLETRMPFAGPSGAYPTPAPTMSSITPANGGSHHHYPGGSIMPPHPRDEHTSPTGPSAAPPSGEKSSSSRPLVKPPGGVSCCRACGTTESPEWRKSESGIKDLCNACGLRLARAQAKKEGRQKPRKKKDKTVATP